MKINSDLDILVYLNIISFLVNIMVFIVVILSKPIPNVKMLRPNKFENDLKEIKDIIKVTPLNEDDIEKIKLRFPGNVSVPLTVTFITVFEIIIGKYILNETDIFFLYKFLGVLFVPIFFFITNMIIITKKKKIFNDIEFFTKRNGMLLDYKILAMPTPGPAYGKVECFYVTVGTYIDDKMFVFQSRVPYGLFMDISKDNKCYIVMYKNKVVEVIY
ncbi:MAG: hypothetical protein IJ053_06840 [Lachnospiraceae bacterium]|nr:hypothetical protein [Lachnospiraceae bacterium]